MKSFEFSNKQAALLWKTLKDMDGRKILLIAAGADLIFWLMSVILLNSNAGYTLGVMIAVLIIVALGCFFSAAFLAIPGWLVRGTYDLRPLFLSAMFSMMLAVLYSEILMPLSFGSPIGFVWKLAAITVLAAGQFLFMFAFLMTTFPHRWGKNLMIITTIFTLLGCVTTMKSVFAPRTDYLKEVFEKKEANLVPMMGGRTVSSAHVGYELLLFDSEAQRTFKASEENQPRN